MIGHPPLGKLAALDELSDQKRARVRRHLARCQTCRDELRFVRDLRTQARAVTSPALLDDSFARIRARREAGERVILPAAAPAARRRRKLALPITIAASTIAAVAIAAQLVIRETGGRPPDPIGDAAPPTVESAVGIAILPSGAEADVSLSGTGPIRLIALLHDEDELGVRGRGEAERARFRAARGGISVSELTGGVLEVRIPRSLVSRIYWNERLEIAAGGGALRADRTGATGERVALDVGR